VAELVISFGGKKFQSFKIKKWTKDLKRNLKVGMFDISIELERALKKKLSKPQRSFRTKKGKKRFVSPSPFKEVRARFGGLYRSFGGHNPDGINIIKKEGGLPALHFGTRIVYARVHEFGYKNIPRRPYFGPTVKKKKKFIVKTLAHALRFK